MTDPASVQSRTSASPTAVSAAAPETFFLCGPPKSGTTWLQLMLHAHPDLVCGGEGHLTDWLLAPLRRQIETYNTEIQENNALIYGERATHEGFTEGDFNEISRFIIQQRLDKLARIKPGARWVGDKTPNYAYAIGLLTKIFPRGRILFLIRDPRDSVVSMIRQTRRLEARRGVTLYETDHEIFAGYLKKWLDLCRLFRRFREAEPDRALAVRYEELIVDETAVLAGIARFLEVSDDDRAIAAMRESGRFETLSGGRKRGQVDTGSFFRRGEAGSWKTELPDDLAERLPEEVKDEMQRFGYALD